ncbi:DNA/RNA non-specific endonuclease [Candidatus Colwellia aromaticivorans]|uniref:DNA/RNA non-specific endonuclease n=1 Tax=Candidatus Colwellia aromaticivorans TaxID=2267621 RepID=UPI000DF30FE0|nr:DNA/RNA non-specific endonuclease [Candidatus Colwellia aromaticivorans]
MIDLPSLKRETRYGMPAADQILFNRHYVVGYSYYFRQAKWALEIIDPNKQDITTVDRMDNFRSDYRIPKMFRADNQDYRGSGHDRGHLVASADLRDTEIQNSETFLLSNMSPQKPQFNRGIWKNLESEVRKLDSLDDVLETYVISGPIFNFDRSISTIGIKDNNNVTLPVPHEYFKSILAETSTGKLKMWSFVFPNEPTDDSIESFQVITSIVEKKAGILLWERLVGPEIDKEKNKINSVW